MNEIVRAIKDMPPFAAQTAYLNMTISVLKENPHLYHKSKKSCILNVAQIVNGHIYTNISFSKDVAWLLEHTDVEIAYSPLPFENMFIETDITHKNIIIKGFSVRDDGKTWHIGYWGLDLDDNGDFYGFFSLEDDGSSIAENFRTEQERQISLQIHKRLKSFTTNICNFLEHNQEEITVFTQSNEARNEKRIKRGKPPINKTVVIRLNRQLHHTISEMQRQAFTYSHKFIVRGHWRHYDEYKRWIKPFWKGKGIKVHKNYEVKQ